MRAIFLLFITLFAGITKKDSEIKNKTQNSCEFEIIVSDNVSIRKLSKGS